jgi:hypothetical protein
MSENAIPVDTPELAWVVESPWYDDVEEGKPE